MKYFDIYFGCVISNKKFISKVFYTQPLPYGVFRDLSEFIVVCRNSE